MRAEEGQTIRLDSNALSGLEGRLPGLARCVMDVETNVVA